jgi:uncharacterized protein YbaR (Trm112 family)
MQRDLLDALRCPGAHEEAWLVAMVHVARGADLREADLACPVCGREFAIRDGIACFCVSPGAAHDVAEFDATSLSGDSVSGDGEHDAGVRLAAQLGVMGGETPVLLTGDYTRVGYALHAWTTAPQLWLNARVPVTGALQASVLCVEQAPLPLGAATLAAAAVDASHAHAPWLSSVVRCIRQGGHLIAPAATPVPDGVRELARDDREWVGEVLTPPSGLVTLRRQSVPA